MKQPIRFLTNKKGERTGVVIAVKDYQAVLDRLEELRGLVKIKASAETLPSAEDRLSRPDRAEN